MRNGEVLEEGAVCSFVTGSTSSDAASIPALHVGGALHPSAACWRAGSGEEGKRGREGEKQHIMWVSGEDHDQAVTHAATELGENQTRKRNEEGRSGGGEKCGAECTQKPRRKGEEGEEGRKRRGGARGKNRVHLTSARLCSSHATMPCCCVRSASMPMPMRGNIIHGISAIITMMSCLCASVFSNQPSLCVCVCVCVCRGHASAGSRQESTHPQKRREERECVREEEKGNSRPNEPTK